MDFNTISATLVPGVYIELDNSRAQQGLSALPNKTLIFGQMLATGTATPLVPVRVTRSGDADTLFGRGSMLAAMVKAFAAANPRAEVWALPLEDAATGTKSTRTLDFSAGGATSAGTLSIRIAGRAVKVPVTEGMSDGQIVGAWVDAVNAMTDLPVTASYLANLVTLTCRWAGWTGDSIAVALETGVDGVPINISASFGGGDDPDLTDAIAALGDEHYTTFVTPYTNMSYPLEAELERRAGGMTQLMAHAFCAIDGTHGSGATWAESRNSPYLTCLGLQDSPTPPWEAASLLAAVEVSEPDPARPRQTLALTGLIAPESTSRYTREERDLHLADGLATFTVDGGGVCRIERLVTTYTETAGGIPDASYRDIEIMRTLAALRFTLRARLALRFPRHKLADDGYDIPPGAAIVTPSIARGELVALFSEWQEAGWVENAEQFKTDLVVERNATDPNRLDVQLPPDLVNQLRVIAGQIQFRV